jgi:hypothetical protein
MYRTYDVFDNYTTNNGLETGYEKNTFFGSRGIQLKTRGTDNTIILVDWIDTFIDENKKTVKLNITETLINYITFSEGFMSNWTGLNSTEAINKTKYIKNSILNNINIGSNCTFKLYSVEDSTIFRFFDYSSNYTYKEITNSNSKIIKENDTYYIELKDLNTQIYTATFIIKL